MYKQIMNIQINIINIQSVGKLFFMVSPESFQ